MKDRNIVQVLAKSKRANKYNKPDALVNKYPIEGPAYLCQGGFGGKILYVTTLSDNDREGSLRWAVNQKYARIIKFKIGGVINLNSRLTITSPFLTIDGSDSPTPVTIKNGTLMIKQTFHVFITHIRVRPGDEVTLKKNIWKKKRYESSCPQDAITIETSVYICVDHVSTSWSSDECLSVTDSIYVTVQNCIIAEPLANPKLHNGSVHNFGALQNGDYILYIKNIFHNYKIRGTQMGIDPNQSIENQGRLAFINNVCSNYEKSGTRISIYDSPTTRLLIIAKNNIYGPVSLDGDKGIVPHIEFVNQSENQKFTFSKDNKFYFSPDYSDKVFRYPGGYMDTIKSAFVSVEPWELTNVDLIETNDVKSTLLNEVGATKPKRDIIDDRIISIVGSFTPVNKIISQDDVGGYNE